MITPDDFLEKIFSKQPSFIRPGLERVSEAYRHLGSPCGEIPTILIGGTNGKGTTASVSAMVLDSLGFRVGLYTSPHLLAFTERICVSQVKTELHVLSELYSQMEKKIPEDLWKALTFFEATTLLGLVFFESQNCDVLVIEVGLGGRLDATNILSPLVSVVTSVDLDHTEWLGGTIELIAKEKFGIARAGRPLVLSDQVLSKGLLPFAQNTGAEVIIPAKSKLPNWVRSRPKIFQKNAVVALEATKQFIDRMRLSRTIVLPDEIFPAHHTFIPPALAGRALDLVFNDKRIFLDVSHNPAGVREAIRAFQQKFGACRPPIFCSVLADKDIDGILNEFSALSGQIVFFRTQAIRGVKSAQELSLLWKGRFEWYDSFEELWLNWNKKISGEGAALIGGSFAAVASALEYFGATDISDINFDTMEFIPKGK